MLREAIDLMKQITFAANLRQVCDMLESAGCYEAIFELSLTAAHRRDPQNVALHYYEQGEPAEDIEGRQYYEMRAECYKCMMDCLSGLVRTPVVLPAPLGGGGSIGPLGNASISFKLNSKESVDEQIHFLVKYVVACKDELAHVALFNWMIDNGFEKRLVTLDSAYLQAYLIKMIRDEANNRVYLDLLWRHYDYKKDYPSAAKVLTALAEKYWYVHVHLLVVLSISTKNIYFSKYLIYIKYCRIIF